MSPEESVHPEHTIATPLVRRVRYDRLSPMFHDITPYPLAAILRSHTTATFTCAMKLGVGLIDARLRDWLHNGDLHIGKLLDINSAIHVDLVVSDALRMNMGYSTDPVDEVEPSVIIASNNVVASDAVAVALMRRYKTVRVVDKPTREHEQFRHARRLGLGSPSLDDIELKAVDLVGDSSFSDLVEYVMDELED